MRSGQTCLRRATALEVFVMLSVLSSTTRGTSGTLLMRWPRASTREGRAEAASAETTAYLQIAIAR